VAILYLGYNMRIYPPIKIKEPVKFLRIRAEHPLEDERIMTTHNTDTTTVRFDTNASASGPYIETIRKRLPHLLFQRDGQVGPMEWAYLLCGLADFPSCKFDESKHSTINVGFDDPDENVNLKKLKRHFRRSKKLKRMLLKYFRAD